MNGESKKSMKSGIFVVRLVQGKVVIVIFLPLLRCVFMIVKIAAMWCLHSATIRFHLFVVISFCYIYIDSSFNCIYGAFLVDIERWGIPLFC